MTLVTLWLDVVFLPKVISFSFVNHSIVFAVLHERYHED